MTLNLWAIMPLCILAWVALSFLCGSVIGRMLADVKPRRLDWRALWQRALLPR